MLKVTVLILIGSSLSSYAYGIRCEGVFKSVAKASHELVVLPAEPPKTNVSVKLSSNLVKEIIEIRDGHMQIPDVPYVGSSFTGAYTYRQTPTGESFTITIFPQGSPFSQKNEYVQQDSARLGMNTGRLGITNSSSTTNQNRMTIPNQLALKNETVPAVSDYEVMKLDLEKSMPGRTVDSAMMEQIMSVARQNPDIIAKARARYRAHQLTKPVELSTIGIDRYFWFKPDGSESYYPARLLDIHRVQKPELFSFFAEYVVGQRDDGVRLHKVQALTESEFRTIEVTSVGRTRADAKEIFLESLSLDEISAIKLAESYGLKVYGYSAPDRGPGLNLDFVMSPLEQMNRLTHLATRTYILDRFGSLDDLLTPTERNRTLYNVIDVIGRQSPMSIKERFMNEKGLGTEFIWVITETGQLKVSPSNEAHADVYGTPLTLRLAAGKKIFAGGTFTLERDYSIKVQLNGTGYLYDTFGNGQSAFQDQGPNLNPFIQQVFSQQMNSHVKSVNSSPLEIWEAGSRVTGAGRQNSGSTGQQYYDRHSSTDDYATGPRSNGQGSRRGSAKNEIITPWNLEKDTPIHLSEFAERAKTHGRDQETQLQWAHYVLKTNSQMSLAEIKQQYRRLAQRFHQDRNKEERAVATTQAVTAAYRVIEEFVR